MRLIRVGRRQRGDVTEKESEESCPGPLPSVSQAAAQRETDGERRRGPTDCPITTPAGKPGAFFGFPERALVYFFEMLFPYLSKCTLSESQPSFGGFPAQSCGFHAGGCSVCACAVETHPAAPQEDFNLTAGKLPYSRSPSEELRAKPRVYFSTGSACLGAGWLHSSAAGEHSGM